ncbi:MAG: radical SAM family heme chaperone HemW, partial [Clostridia bacterium]|nr:radical SAM family heme chaperone HemW [Clostridia bacterium]
IPFCKSRCIYCDFVSSIGDQKNMDKYVEYLSRQIIDEGKRYSQDYIVDTIYFGGGTPSLLSNEHIEILSKTIANIFELNLKEFSVEANPCTVDEQKLQTLKRAGVTRLSLGVQTFNDDLLKMLGRRHNSEQAKQAIKLALNYGFDVSVDCMLALPDQTLDDVNDFVDTAADLGVEHISAYMLSVEDGTALKRLIEENVLKEKSDDEEAEFYDHMHKLLKERGYSRYEVSNFCKNYKVSFHNLKYWKGDDYLGLGLSAHSLINGERWRCASDFDEYYRIIDSGRAQRLDKEKLSISDRKNEMIMLALRLDEGLDIEEYEIKFNENFSKEYARALAKNAEYINYDGKKLSIKEQYVKVMNSIVVDFIK